MQALEMVGARVQLTQRPVPDVGRGEVRVRVAACGANASDWEFIVGRPFYGWLARRLMRVKVPGSDVAGVVDAVGEGVKDLIPGDRVVADTFETFGGFADFCTAKADRWVKLPDDIGFEQAAALPQSAAIALTAFDHLAGGETVLINGAGGGSGPYAIQLAKARGATVWAVDNAGKQAIMHASGADHVIDYETTDFTTVGTRFDHILDMVATRPPRHIRRCLAPGGRYRMVGGPMGLLILFALRGQLLIVKQGPGLTARALDLVTRGVLTPNIGAVVPLADGPDALARMGAGQIAGKLIVAP